MMNQTLPSPQTIMMMVIIIKHFSHIISLVLHGSNIDHDSNILILKKGVLFLFKWLTFKVVKYPKV